MPWCPRCGTGLSEHEIVTEGYKEIVHPGLFIKFPLLVPSPSMGEGQMGVRRCWSGRLRRGR